MQSTVIHQYAEQLLTNYESGGISRRAFLASLTALAATSTNANAATASPVLEVKSLNHATLFVKDIPKTAALYQSLFGLQVKSRQGTGINLAVGAGNQFIGLFGGLESTQPRIDHVCLGIKNFSVDTSMRALAAQGLTGRVRMRDDKVPELYFNDPNGISIQLQDESYCGGSGVLGNECIV